MYTNRKAAIFCVCAGVFISLGACAAAPTAHADISAQSEEGYTVPYYDTYRTFPKTTRDTMTVVFSKAKMELDFRASYLASEAQLYTALYEGLYSYEPETMLPVNALAQRAELSADKKKWTFTLRNGAKYWNGDPVRAGDFRAAWLSLIEPARNSPYSSLFDIIEGAQDYRLGKLRDPNKVGIDAPDERTLVVRLTSPAAFFPSMLCHHSFSPIHPSMLQVRDWTLKPPLSNGPFYIEEIREDRFVLVKNEAYWDADNVAIRKINFVFADAEQSAELWRSSEARWISGEIDFLQIPNTADILVNPMFATHYYYIRSALKPWNDQRVRRALSIVLPWEEIREDELRPAKSLILRTPGYPLVTGFETADKEESLRLLEEAGFPGGVGIPELVIRLTPSKDAQRVCAIMAQAWRDLGIRVRLDVVPYDEYFQSLKQNDYVVGSTTWIADFADPYSFLQMWRRDSNLNDAKFSDDDYERLIDISMTEEGRKRLETLAEAERLLLDRGSVLPISHTVSVNVIKNIRGEPDEVSGWYANILDIHPFKYMHINPPRPLPNVALFSQ
ncbi:peptide ABC transporter substrate-binding protein [Breznakiellaceae bacterium SP9]